MASVRDGYSNKRFFEVLAPQSYSTGSVTGATVDRQGYETLTFVVNMGEISGVASALVSVDSCGWVRMQHGTSNAAGTVVWSNCSAEQILVDLRLGDSDTVLGSADGSDTDGWGSASMGVLAVSNAGSGINNGTFLCLGGVSADHQSYWESKCHPAGYVGDHRWVRLVLSVSDNGDASALGICAIAILEKAADWPVNTVRLTG